LAAIYQTAYPRIKSNISKDELGDIYTLTKEEQKFALRHCKQASVSFLGLLIQLKITQRLGRFSSRGEIPKAIIIHIGGLRPFPRKVHSSSECQKYHSLAILPTMQPVTPPNH